MTKERKKGRGRLPLFQGLLPIKPQSIPTDILAGITLAALGIPEVMGYTKIAGTPVITGLYTMLLPVVVFAIFGASRHLVVGADSATAAILAAGLTGVAVQDTPEYVALAGALALMAAFLLILARLIRLGFLANFLAKSVLIGFLTGVGIQVALGQVGGMLGVHTSGSGTLQQFASALQQLPQANIATVLISVVVLLIVLGAARISTKIPGALIAVVGMIIASYALNLSTTYGVAILGPVPGGLPKFGLPDVTLNELPPLLTTALSIFFVILAQSAATSRAYASRYHEDCNENADLIGLGLASIAAGISGTFVVNGSPTKTEMVDSSGGQSQLAQMSTAAIVLLVLLFLTAPLAYMPTAVLSAVVFLIGISLIDVKGMRRIFRLSKAEFIVAAITIITVVMVGVEQGIGLAIVLSLIDHLRHSYKPFDAVMVPVASGRWKMMATEQGNQAAPGLVVYLFGAGLYYANAARFSQEIRKLVEGAQPKVRWFVLDAAAMTNIDYTGADTIQQVHQFLRKQEVTLLLSNVVDIVQMQLDQYGLTTLIGEEHFYDTLAEVLEAYVQETNRTEVLPTCEDSRMPSAFAHKS